MSSVATKYQRIMDSSEVTRRHICLGNLFINAGLDANISSSEFDRPITGISDDSRNVLPGNIFVAISGNATDGHLFLSDAVEHKAAALVVERSIPPYPGVAIIRVPDARVALARLAHSFFGNPTKDKIICGITGTNGKTTTAYLLRSCLEAAGLPTALLGTIEYDLHGYSIRATNTTPSPLRLARLFSQMGENGVNTAVMEVSSHAIHQKRILGINYSVGIFTNFTQDHLDYHGSLDAYREVKRHFFTEYLFENPRSVGVFNIDDATGRDFAKSFTGRKITYGLGSDADVSAEEFTLNILAAAAGALAIGIKEASICEGIAGMKSVPGRFERIDEGQPFSVIVDYAHTPDALERSLANARDIASGRIITVFGCGGDRDRSKRPLMGAAVARTILHNPSNFAIITNDNPRSEPPAEIAHQAEDGLLSVLGRSDRYKIILDRKEAIRRAVSRAGEGDVVLIAGKGHEDYQIIGKRVLHFDDREAAWEILHEMGFSHTPDKTSGGR